MTDSFDGFRFHIADGNGPQVPWNASAGRIPPPPSVVERLAGLEDDEIRERNRRLDQANDDLERWRAYVRPAPEDLAFEAIPWIPSYAEGLRRADAEGRPLLFWAMNGHPLGCT